MSALVGETLDSLAHGAVRLAQRIDGYRFGTDAVLLADFAAHASERPPAQVVELGAGCGVVTLLLARRWPGTQFTGVELQPALAELFARNVIMNGVADRVRSVCGDLRDPRVLSGQVVELVLCNPPYRPLGTGRRSVGRERALARHEIACTLSDVIVAAARQLKPGGRLRLIYPVARLAELIAVLHQNGLEPKRLRFVHPRPDAPARLLLMEATRGGASGLDVLAPLVLYDVEGRPMPEFVVAQEL